MQHYRSFTPGMQVRGQMIQAAVRCLNSDHLEPYLRENGLLGRQDDLQPILADRWYSQQDWLNVLNALVDANASSAMFDLVSVGITLVEMFVAQGELEGLSLEEKLEALSRIYQAQHRDGDAGQIAVTRTGDRQVRVEARTAYPDDIFYGAIYAIASRHFPDGEALTVRYDDSLLRRDRGGEMTRYAISW